MAGAERSRRRSGPVWTHAGVPAIARRGGCAGSVSNKATASRLAAARRDGLLHQHRHGPLAPFLGDAPVLVAPGEWTAADGAHDVVLSAYQLQDIADYRAALRAWFGAVRIGGYLVVVVPHAFLHERQLELPSRWNPAQRHLYSPGTLMEQVEEALAPNSYRVRLLADDDTDYAYDTPSTLEPAGHSDVLLVLERIAPPAWTLDVPLTVKAAAPDYAFEPARTRVEVPAARTLRKVLILKLDHLGDFIMGLSALEKARAVFADAEITLVVGSWNAQMARASGLADHVVAFDAFPRNSTEEQANVPAREAIFRETVQGEYDIAIDLRTDLDTRFLLRCVKAGMRAGIGTRAQFPWLDIFLPLDFNRNEPETAREYKYNNHDFISQGPVKRGDYRSVSSAETVERHCAIIWGPYHSLRAGRYFFEPYIELAPNSDGMLLLDIGMDNRRVAFATLPSSDPVRLSFAVEQAEASFEFRVWTVENMPSIDFSFFGGRLVREGAASVLHQSEYLFLLIELIATRLQRTGMLTEAGAR